MIPLMNATGRNTAISESVVASTARPMSRVAERRGDEGLLPLLLDEADDVLEHDDGVVDDDADGQREREQRDDVEREAHRPTSSANVPMIETGMASAAMIVLRDVAEEDEHDERREERAEHEVLLDRVDARPNRGGLVAHDLELGARGQRLLDLAEARPDRVDDRDRVLAPTACESRGRRSPCPSSTRPRSWLLRAVLDPRDVARRASGGPGSR